MHGTDVYHSRRSEPSGERRDREARLGGRNNRHDSAANKNFAPFNSCLVERADRDGTYTAWWSKSSEFQDIATMSGEARRGKPANFVHHELFTPAAGRFLPHQNSIQRSRIKGVQKVS